MTKKKPSKKKLLIMAWVVPSVLWVIHFLWVQGFNIYHDSRSIGFWMMYAFLGLAFPVLATIIGVWWNIKTFRTITEKSIRHLSFGGILFWLICIIVLTAVMFSPPSNEDIIAPARTEVIPQDK